MSYEDAARKNSILVDGLETIAGVVNDQLSLAAEAQKLLDRAQQIRQDRFRVLVVGEFKGGKSTLINAMLGDDILPRRVLEATAVVTIIQYGDSPQVRIVFDNEQPDEILSAEEFRTKYELNIDDTVINAPQDKEEKVQEALDRFSHVTHGVLSYPIDLCRHGVELVDTPGLGAHVARTNRTLHFLPKADAIIFVLNAVRILSKEENDFLELLLTMGLRNIFFVINRWNLVAEQALTPAEADQNRDEIVEKFKRRLEPLCQIDGQNRSTERVFYINAFGALRARANGTSSPEFDSLLNESNVPAFEQALQTFLMEHKFRVRVKVSLSVLQSVCENVDRYIKAQIQQASKSIDDIKMEQEKLHPKLDRLRGIRQHIVGYLDSQSANLQDRLALSFQRYLKRLQDELPEKVDAFDWAEINRMSMVWASITDWTREEQNKFGKKVENCLKPQIQSMLELHFAKWQQAIVQHEMPAMMIDVNTHLKQEAEEYRRVMHEIEESLGIQGRSESVEALVERWLLPSEGYGSVDEFRLAGLKLFGDFGWLFGAVALDVATDIYLHLATVWLPVVGVVISAARLVWREIHQRQHLRNTVLEELRNGLSRIEQAEMAQVRQRVQEGFDGLKRGITANIDDEIGVIAQSLQSLIDRKTEQELSVEEERERLETARASIIDTFEHLQQALS